MRGTWHCLTAGCTIHGEGEWKAINIAAEKHGKAESHSTTVAYIYPPELGKYPPERHQPSARTDAEAIAAAQAAAAADPPMDPWKVLEAMHVDVLVKRLVADLAAERDRARAVAVALEGQVAAVRALAQAWRQERASLLGTSSQISAGVRATLRACAWDVDAALDPDPADRGREERP